MKTNLKPKHNQPDHQPNFNDLKRPSMNSDSTHQRRSKFRNTSPTSVILETTGSTRNPRIRFARDEFRELDCFWRTLDRLSTLNFSGNLSTLFRTQAAVSLIFSSPRISIKWPKLTDQLTAILRNSENCNLWMHWNDAFVFIPTSRKKNRIFKNQNPDIPEHLIYTDVFWDF